MISEHPLGDRRETAANTRLLHAAQASVRSKKMTKRKRLNSVAHSIAHHAVSALSYVHPHLGEACADVGVHHVVIDVMQDDPCPPEFRDRRPLRLSVGKLKETLSGILESEGFSLDALREAKLTFYFKQNRTDHYCSICNAVLVDSEGTTHEDWVDYMGMRPNKILQDIVANAPNPEN